MLLMELFTDPYEWESDEDNGGQFYSYTFTADSGAKYDVEIDHMNNNANDVALWNVEFSNQSVPAGSRFGVTGSGNSPQVMATVMDIVYDFAQSNSGVFTFSAKEPSRASLYGRMLKRFIKPPLVVSTTQSSNKEQVFFVGMPDQVKKFHQQKEEETARTNAYMAQADTQSAHESVNNSN